MGSKELMCSEDHLVYRRVLKTGGSFLLSLLFMSFELGQLLIQQKMLP